VSSLSVVFQGLPTQGEEAPLLLISLAFFGETPPRSDSLTWLPTDLGSGFAFKAFSFLRRSTGATREEFSQQLFRSTAWLMLLSFSFLAPIVLPFSCSPSFLTPSILPSNFPLSWNSLVGEKPQSPSQPFFLSFFCFPSHCSVQLFPFDRKRPNPVAFSLSPPSTVTETYSLSAIFSPVYRVSVQS